MTFVIIRLVILFAIVLLNCRVAAQSDARYDRTLLRSRNLRREKAVTTENNNNLDQPYQVDAVPVIADQLIQSIENRNDAQATSTSSSRNLQTQSWRTNNNNNRNSGINSDGTTGEYYWKDRINKGLRNVGIVIVIWFVVVGSIGTVCRCYLCWESIMRNSFGYNTTFDEDDNYVESDERYSDERLNGVDMAPISSLNERQV